MGFCSSKNSVSLESVLWHHGEEQVFSDKSSLGFKEFIDGHAWPAPTPPVQLLCRRIGEQSVMTCFTVEGVRSDGLSIQESIEATVSQRLPTTSLSFTLTVRACCSTSQSDMFVCIVYSALGRVERRDG